MQAEKLLRSFPWQYAVAKNRRAELEEPMRARDMTSPYVSSSLHADPTAGAAIDLEELSQLETKLKLIRQWIDTLTSHRERQLLISVWRGAKDNFPWYYVARNAKLHPVTSRVMWRGMVSRLNEHMGGVDDKRHRDAS